MPHIDLKLPAELDEFWQEIYLVLVDYAFHGAKYQTSIELLQEIGLNYNQACTLMSELDLSLIENEKPE